MDPEESGRSKIIRIRIHNTVFRRGTIESEIPNLKTFRHGCDVVDPVLMDLHLSGFAHNKVFDGKDSDPTQKMYSTYILNRKFFIQ